MGLRTFKSLLSIMKLKNKKKNNKDCVTQLITRFKPKKDKEIDDYI